MEEVFFWVRIQTCLIFPLRWACFPIEICRNAQWEHLFSLYFKDFSTIYLFFSLSRTFLYENVNLTCLILKWPNHIKYKNIYTNQSIFSMVKVSLSGNTIYLRLLSMKGFDAFQPKSNCFISMIICVAKLSGF